MLRIRMSGKLGAAFAAVALLLSASVAWAQARNAVESINFSAVQGGRTIVKIGMKEPLAAVPQAFQVTNPPRIAIDLPDTVNALGRNQVQAGEGDLRSVSIVQTPNRTRVVMNLTRNLTYTQALDGKTLVVTVEGAASTTSTTPATTAPTASTTFAEAQPGVATRYNLRDVDFRRGNTGEGRVVVDLSSASVGIDIRQQGRQLLVDFINTDVPKNLVRRLDVGDFATPVRFVDTFEQSGNARMVIEPRGLWEYSAYQTDTQFILEVKPVKEDPNRLVQSATPGYAGEKLSLNFQNVEVRAVLQVIADFTGLNIITSDTVGGNLTLRLKDVPWDQALDIILQAKGLSKRKNGNVVLIAPTDELAAKEKLALEATAAISDLEPVRTESFALSYAKAEDLRKMLTDKDQKILSKRGSATFDERTNTIFVQDTGGRLEEVRRLITQLDIPVRQVLIEARIVIADDKWGRQLGARFGTQSAFHSSNYNYGVSGSPFDTSATLGNNPVSRGSASLVSPFLGSGTTTFSSLQPMGGQPEQLNVNLPVAGAAGSLAVSILNLGSGNLVNMELSALEADNRGKVVSSPRVITADKKKAVITQGTEIPYQTASASGATTVSFKPATLELSVTPRITPDDRIIMDLDVKKDTLGQLVNAGAAGNIPAIDTRKVSTQVLVDNGDTIVLGGIFEQETRTTTNKVPFLGDIPILGNLFKRTTKQDDKTELLIFVTPKIVKESMMVR